MDYNTFGSLSEILLDPDFILVKHLFSLSSVDHGKTLGESLMTIFVRHKDKGIYLAIELVKYLINLELTDQKCTSTLFRENSWATSLMTGYTKLVGYRYLKHTIMYTVIEIINITEEGINHPFELKLGKVTDEERQKNMQCVIQIVSDLLDRVMNANDLMSRSVLHIAIYISKACLNMFPDNELVQYTVIGGLLFLRFLCPALINPELFQIVSNEMPIDSARPALIFISKILQLIANQKVFDERHKDFMDLNPFMIQWGTKYRTWISDLLAYEGIGREDVDQSLFIPNVKYDQSKKIIYDFLVQNKPALLETLTNSSLEPTSKEYIRSIINNIEEISISHQSSPRNSEEIEIRYERKTAKSIVHMQQSVSLARSHIDSTLNNIGRFKLNFSSIIKKMQSKNTKTQESRAKSPVTRTIPLDPKPLDQNSIILTEIKSTTLHDDYVDQVHVLKSNPNNPKSLDIYPYKKQQDTEHDLNRSRRHAIVKNRAGAIDNSDLNQTKTQTMIIPGLTDPIMNSTSELIQEKSIIKGDIIENNRQTREDQFYIEMDESQRNGLKKVHDDDANDHHQI